jgi:hypothetical protein
VPARCRPRSVRFSLSLLSWQLVLWVCPSAGRFFHIDEIPRSLCRQPVYHTRNDDSYHFRIAVSITSKSIESLSTAYVRFELSLWMDHFDEAESPSESSTPFVTEVTTSETSSQLVSFPSALDYKRNGWLHIANIIITIITSKSTPMRG